MRVITRSSALVLIEFQNQWTEPGLYHSLIKRQLESRAVIDNTRKLVNESRGSGIKIIHAPLVIDPQNKKGWLAHLTFGKVFTRGSRNAEITPGLYQEGDLLVQGKYAFDAFLGSNLEEILRSVGARTLFVGGFTTDQCVAKTLRSALQKGFDAHLIPDCTAALTGFLQKKTEREFRERLLGYREILALLD